MDTMVPGGRPSIFAVAFGALAAGLNAIALTYTGTPNQVSISQIIQQLETKFKWLYTISALIDPPVLNPHLLIHMCTSHSWSLVSKIYYTFLHKFCIFSLMGRCPYPFLVGLLTSGFKTCDNIVCGHITVSD